LYGNSILITGSIWPKGKDVEELELRFSQKGTAILNFQIGSYGGKDQDGNTKDKVYWTCVAFGDLAENIAESCLPGDNLVVSGSVESDNWEPEDGDKKYRNQIVVREAGLNLRWTTGTPLRTERTDYEKADKPKVQTPEEAPF
jgi:single-strand DNA-binding protein